MSRVRTRANNGHKFTVNQKKKSHGCLKSTDGSNIASPQILHSRWKRCEAERLGVQCGSEVNTGGVRKVADWKACCRHALLPQVFQFSPTISDRVTATVTTKITWYPRTRVACCVRRLGQRVKVRPCSFLPNSDFRFSSCAYLCSQTFYNLSSNLTTNAFSFFN